MAEGRSSQGIAETLVITEAAGEKHVTSIFQKLDLGPRRGEHRRVPAVLAYLRSLHRWSARRRAGIAPAARSGESCDTEGRSRDRRRVFMPPERAIRFVRTDYRERTRMQHLLRFLRRGPISPRVHGTLDYLLAAALIAVPLAVHFHDDTATVLMLVLGGAATVLAIGTNWSTGIIRILPPVVHGVADIAATIVLIIAPFVLGFTDHTVATVLSVVIGAGGWGATLLTRFESDLMPAPRMAPEQSAA
jgi:hypothetical protein